ncbi:UDP-N-acetylglucosamine--N-acetylmuramyl-(pentapeptide) pyrophosphoryl-undecaprenol N-acetylglucosamine transferase [Paenibacillus sp. FSL H8-0548]|uniref:undecaprenyldiphospho-muramoylpentapeptide beta-N-acetylglucosaminyltransferase n=1 Tax=Paenibacillus sp. FSL H8-0548 TaxID=1920422 RepID=UPI00096F33D5|nr:undecaprenyldiphospho-muramoylpentapeptide beta-N-acetylglucosaminyltransferase [Paenibacillus sp. FSL H8-0548]OMF38876.1 UDP-N-acetylglucosamine--N-acetylmuramyl-(pentapeptide) pyrophosphoryl-undecaprenol N-acetylglucosamine transferase [Paenibacillus sp. FSL H8-0548]
MKTIMFTGGGSAGHVTVNLALIPRFLEEGWSVQYIGSESGIERQLTATIPQVKYFPISTGKLRRYVDIQNVKDPFKVVKGLFQAYRLIKKNKPNVIFSKGGFVSVPVVIGAWLNRVPLLIHESDLTPGLANRISIPFATGVCTTFPETGSMLKADKSRHVGAVIREEVKLGNADHGRQFCGFTRSKPIILIMGGSLGARKINQTVRQALTRLTKQFQIVHLCGKNQTDASIDIAGYKQFEYVNEQLPDIFAMTDVVISRAGSNSIFEFLSLKKPMLLIPLTKEQSRGDQILNAQSFEKSGYADVLYEEKLTAATLADSVERLYDDRKAYTDRMNLSEEANALAAVYDWINEIAKR